MTLRMIFLWLVVGVLVTPIVGPWHWVGILGGLWMAGLAIRSG